MMSKRIKKFIPVLLCLLLVTSISTAFVVSQNRHHIDKCCEFKCSYCNTIHVAQELIYKIFISCFCIVFVFVIALIIFKVYVYYYLVIQNTLIFQKVQLNE